MASAPAVNSNVMRYTVFGTDLSFVFKKHTRCSPPSFALNANLPVTAFSFEYSSSSRGPET